MFPASSKGKVVTSEPKVLEIVKAPGESIEYEGLSAKTGVSMYLKHELV